MFQKLAFRLFIVSAIGLLISCGNSEKSSLIIITSKDYHDAQDVLTSIMVHDIFSPPQASRVYAYTNIAAYEIIAQIPGDSIASLKYKLNDFNGISHPKDSLVNLKLAALISFIELGKHMVYSKAMFEQYSTKMSDHWSRINAPVYAASKKYALHVVGEIKTWMNKDNFIETRSFPKFQVNYDNLARWQPTPPDYMDGIEPNWGKIRPFVLESADQFKPILPPKFSLEKDSKFIQEIGEVQRIVDDIRSDSQPNEFEEIAKFWDCNPYVSTHKGHVVFALKKISPGAHWIGIVKIASKKKNLELLKVVEAYTLSAIAIADGFISCWDEKYRSNLVRPETIINKLFDPTWYPILQTPPFPEYTSGHSVISGAASVVLTKLFGEPFNFVDDTETAYGLPQREFESFRQAANEAALSRLYGGIHYRQAIEEGLVQGRKIGLFVSKRVSTTRQ
jgi:hypothetical protein